MSDPRTPHDPIDPRDRAPLDAHRSGASSGMPTWGWAAIAGVVLLLAVMFMWPSGETQQADVDTTPPAATSPATTPPPAAAPTTPQTPPATTPPEQKPAQ